MTILTEDLARTGHYIVSEAHGYRAREEVTIANGAGVLKPGTVLGKVVTVADITASASASSANAANTGTIAMDGTTPLTNAARAGRYKGIAVDATHVRWEDPAGKEIGVSTHGTAFAKGGIKFTITAGGSANSANDEFYVDVVIEPGDVTYKDFDPTATDGSQVACAILYEGCDATDASVRRTITARDSEVVAAKLIWPEGIAAAAKTNAIAALAALGIIGR